MPTKKAKGGSKGKGRSKGNGSKGTASAAQVGAAAKASEWLVFCAISTSSSRLTTAWPITKMLLAIGRCNFNNSQLLCWQLAADAGGTTAECQRAVHISCCALVNTLQGSSGSGTSAAAAAAAAAHSTPLLPPEQRMAAVRPFWQQLQQQQRLDLLSMSIDEVQRLVEEHTETARAAESASDAAAGEACRAAFLALFCLGFRVSDSRICQDAAAFVNVIAGADKPAGAAGLCW
jgi:hypothetical protein